MDGTLRDHRGYPPMEAFLKIKNLIDASSQVKGSVIFNWHNTFLLQSENKWRMVFEQSLNYLVQKKVMFYTCKQLAKKYEGYWS